MEKVLLRIQSVHSDTKKQISEHYRQVVQLEEQMNDNLWQLQFCEGVVEALGQVETFLKEGDLPQSLMRLQSARVDAYCELSKNFESRVKLGKVLGKFNEELGIVKGITTVNDNEKAVLRRHELYEVIHNLNVLTKENDNLLHRRRGIIAGFDEGEKTIDGEMNPVKIKAKVSTSPGAIGPEFEGQAMEKPLRDKFTAEEDFEPSVPTEFHPKAFQRATIDDGLVI